MPRVGNRGWAIDAEGLLAEGIALNYDAFARFSWLRNSIGPQHKVRGSSRLGRARKKALGGVQFS